MSERVHKQLSACANRAAAAGFVGAAVCGLGCWQAPQRFFQSYLFAFLVVSGAGLGSMAVVMLHHLVGGRWGVATRRILEAAAWPLIVALPLALPLWPGITSLYPWADAGTVEHDPLLQSKASYLNVDFFQARAAAMLLAWAVLAWLLSSWSRKADRSGAAGAAWRGRLRTLSAVGLVFYVLSVTCASVDWMMSLEPHWYSSIYGVIVVAGQAAAAFAAAILAVCWLRIRCQRAELAAPEVLQDLGNLLLAAVTFWLYVAFSQLLIIWSGNLAEETPWYLARSRSGWQWLAAALVLLHFALPFAALLRGAVKRSPRALAAVAAVVLVMHTVDVYWLVMPAMRTTPGQLLWLDFAALLTLTCVWVAIAARRLKSGALAPALSFAGKRHDEFQTIRQPRQPG